MLKSKRVSSDVVFLGEESQVKMKTAGNMQEVQFCAGVNKNCPIQNISKEKYVDKKTGEIKERKKSENRYQSPKSVRRSINRLMDLIRCNATNQSQCKWLTLTYAEPMADGSKIFGDGKKFIRKLQSYLDKRSDLSDGQKVFKRISVQMIQVSSKKKARNPAFRNYYVKRCKQGKPPKQVLICISRRLINIIYGMLKNQTEYRMPEVEYLEEDFETEGQ